MMTNIQLVLIEFPEPYIPAIEKLFDELGMGDKTHHIPISSGNLFEILQCEDSAALDKYVVSSFISENIGENTQLIYLLCDNDLSDSRREIIDIKKYFRHILEPTKFIEINNIALYNLAETGPGEFIELIRTIPEIQESIDASENPQYFQAFDSNQLKGIISAQQVSINRLQNQIREQEIQHVSSVSSFSNILEDVARSLIWRLWEIFKRIVYFVLKIMPFLKSLLSRRVHRVGKEYEIWAEQRKLTDEHRSQQIKASLEFSYQPLFSFIVPVYNPPISVFVEMIQSVLRQTYQNWELCLADGGDSAEIQEIIKKFAAEDARIKYKFLKKNLGISRNSNASIKMADGEYILILDHDDAIEENLLFEVATLLNQDPSIDCIYYDEDKIDIKGVRSAPNFKPHTFSPETLLCSNYLTHCTIRKSLVIEAGGFNSAMDGAQDWDLVLHVSEKTTNIVHIPKILYHWRSVPASAASSSFAKPYAFDAQIRCVSNHLIRRGLSSVSYVLHGNKRKIAWEIDRKKVSIITYLDDWNEKVKSEIEALVDFTDSLDLEIIVVTPSRNHQDEFIDDKIKVVSAKYASSFEAYNIGSKEATGDKLLFVHPDIQPFENNWIDELLQWSQRSTSGAVCGKVLKDEFIYQYGCIRIGDSSLSNLYQGLPEDSITLYNLTMNYLNLGYISEFITMVDANIFAEIGGFSNGVISPAIKFSEEIRKLNLNIVYNPFAKFYIKPEKVVNYSLDTNMGEQSAYNDPYFNPSLRLIDGIPLLPSK